MHRRVGSTALHQDVVAIHFPRFSQGSAHYRTAMPAALKLRMRHDVFENPVLAPAPQQVGNGDEHAARNDPGISIRYEDK